MKRASHKAALNRGKRARLTLDPANASENEDHNNSTASTALVVAGGEDTNDNNDNNDNNNNENAQDSDNADTEAAALVPQVLDPALQSRISKICEDVKKGKNQYIAGPAGSGKTVVIKKLRTLLRGEGHVVDVVAPTGRAALNVGGQTCHAYFGLTRNNTRLSLARLVLIGKISATNQRLRNVNILIFDEISMIAAELFEQMDAIMKEARDSNKPFGGCTIVLVGDFAQLAPIKAQEWCINRGTIRTVTVKGKTYTCSSCRKAVQDDDKWLFRSHLWSKLHLQPTHLDKILRQDDPVFKAIIWALYLGKNLSLAQQQQLQALTQVVQHSTKLFPSRQATMNENKMRYDSLNTPEYHFTCVDECILSAGHRGTAIQRMCRTEAGSDFLAHLSEHPYEKRLDLRENMKVMLLRNIDIRAGLVNGTMGEIVGWHICDLAKLPRTSDEHEISGYTLEIDERRVHTEYIPMLARSSLSAKPSQLSRFAQANVSMGNAYPIVEFDNEITAVIYPDVSIEEWPDRGEATLFIRTQLPLIAGWASTIHKAQGLTLDKVTADLTEVFEPGQEYVAISRARSMQRLQLLMRPEGLRFSTPDLVKQHMRNTFPHLKLGKR